MIDAISKLVESGAISEDVQKSIQEAWDSKIKENNLSEVKLVNKTKIEDELQKGKVSILMLTQVDYRTGELYDLKKINNIEFSSFLMNQCF